VNVLVDESQRKSMQQLSGKMNLRWSAFSLQLDVCFSRGPGPTGGGEVLPGFGDQRGIELLFEAGFSPLEAIKIATLNGAIYLGRDKQIGSVAAGKNADGGIHARTMDVAAVRPLMTLRTCTRHLPLTSFRYLSAICRNTRRRFPPMIFRMRSSE
jgi:hypothetical protein